LGRALKKQGADTLFFMMDGPINDAARASFAIKQFCDN